MYREAARIEATVRALAGSNLCGPELELVFVDDGSDDGTVEVLESVLGQAGLDGRVVALGRNEGKGAAVRAGVLAAEGRTIVFADADLSAGVPEIARCFELVEQGAEVVFASRASIRSRITVRQPRLRQLSGKTFNVLLRTLGLTSFADTQCGLKGFTREAARTLFQELETSGFAFDVEVLLRAHRHAMVCREMPIEWMHVEDSRVDPLSDSARMIRDVVRLRRRLGRVGAPAADDTMPRQKFDIMAQLEREHWWFRAKRDLLTRELERAGAGGPVAVDVGCGTGEVVRCLRALPFELVVGTDLSQYALGLVRKEGDLDTPLVASWAEHLPFPSGAAACLTSLDVVEHLDDDVAALREYARAVRPGGVIVIAVPAYMWAWSDHDVVLGHRRRYTRASLLEAAAGAGLVVERCSYYHSWLVPLAFALRRTPLRHLVRREAEEASFVSPAVNRLLVLVAAAERRVGAVAGLPFGLSIMLVARSPGRAGTGGRPSTVQGTDNA